VSSSASLAAAAEVPVLAPEYGQVDQLMVKEGDRVEPGAALFAYDVGDLQLRRAGLREQLESARAPLRAAVGRTAEGAALAETLSRAEAEVARAQAALLQEQKESAGAPVTERVTDAEKRFSAAHTASQLAKSELDARIPPDAPGAAKAAEVEREIARLEQQIKVQTVTAAEGGVVSKIYARPGQPIDRGQKVMQLDDLSRMRLIATVSPKHVKNVTVGTPITVRIGEDRIHTTVEAVSGDEIAAEVPNLDGSLKPGVVQVQIDLPPSSLAKR
jgi:HlyD family secretion protein